MKKILIMATMLLSLGACNKEEPDTTQNGEEPRPKVVDLKLVDGKYEIECEPISMEEFAEKFQPGWDCYAIHDVYPDGSIGGDYTDVELNGGSLEPNWFSVLSDNMIKEYIFWNDEFDHYQYELIPYSYEENSNEIIFEGRYYSLSYHVNDFGKYEHKTYELNSGIVTSLNESKMDLVAPLCRAWASEDAIYTLFRFKRLTKEKVAKLDSLYIEPR